MRETAGSGGVSGWDCGTLVVVGVISRKALISVQLRRSRSPGREEERRGRPRKKRERECEIERLGCRAELYRERRPRVWDAGGPENRIVQLEDAPRENVGVLLGGTAAASGR